MGKRMMKGAAWLLASTAAMLLVTAWMDWYMTLAAGALLALVRRSRPSGLLAFVSGGIGWIGPVLFLADPTELFVFTERIGGAFGLSGMAASAAVLLLPFVLGGLLAAGGSCRSAWRPGCGRSGSRVITGRCSQLRRRKGSCS
ncbi:hypothetical protein [Paenibacillus mucilaginosus]|uniref:hypothetical protein n=1 Tax=Paenibacillus mucilaginosus TaxID=61624 RepID=UPI00240DF503|nr:hypothetical protein [Paenibacillus mucilaginosus]